MMPQVGNHNLKPREEVKVSEEEGANAPAEDPQNWAYMHKDDAR